MKINIITIVDNINFGSILQAYALCHKIDELGYKVEIIDYWRPGSTTIAQVKGIIKNERRSIVNRTIYAFSAIMLVPWIKFNLRSFLRRRFKFTRRYDSVSELRRATPDGDIFLTGSDQVWNCSYNGGVDEAFFLDFTENPKLSYASSMGTDVFPPTDEARIVGLLRKYVNLSLREAESCGYIESLGLPRPVHCIDPTLLLDKEEWMSQVPENKTVKHPFLLVYSVEGELNDFIFMQAKNIARSKGLKIYALTASDPFKLKKYGCDGIFSFANCETFLQLMYHASFIVASSFHGTAFAINFGKEFVTITPDRFNVRMRDLMTKLNLDRIVDKGDNFHIEDLKTIDYKIVNNAVTQWREASINYLESILKSI